MPWPEDIFATHSAALSTMSSAIFWILALALDLMWTFTRDNAPAINSDNSSMRISSSVGLGLPLLLTAIIASFHAFLPRYGGLPSEAPWYEVLNPRIGQRGRCFISAGEPFTRVLLLFHLPIFCIVLVNTFFFFIIVRRIFYTKRNSIIRNQNQAANELQEQMVRNNWTGKLTCFTSSFSVLIVYQVLRFASPPLSCYFLLWLTLFFRNKFFA